MTRLKVVREDGEAVADIRHRWRSWRPKRWQVGAFLLLAGAGGWVALVALSTYTVPIIGGTTFVVLVAGWRLLTDRLADPAQQTVRHVHVRRWL